MIIYFNSSCSKCNQALDLLQSAGCPVEIRNYLEQPPGPEELRSLLKLLGCKAGDLVRKKEELYLSTYQGREISDEEWLVILSENPQLIERPIVVDGERALIGRPPELVLNLVTPSQV